MSEQPKRWTFAALTGRMPPFFMVRRRRRWRDAKDYVNQNGEGEEQ
ncbi:MAG: hypothetical protein IJC66_07340 [Kiritimatiellae bacterium]|nr:hypothetical protein [Kiritimatiellia bacterium]